MLLRFSKRNLRGITATRHRHGKTLVFRDVRAQKNRCLAAASLYRFEILAVQRKQILSNLARICRKIFSFYVVEHIFAEWGRLDTFSVAIFEFLTTSTWTRIISTRCFFCFVRYLFWKCFVLLNIIYFSR